jgi:DNA polymerase III epsilon subunit-like protein
MSRRKPKEHPRHLPNGLVTIINRGVKYLKRNLHLGRDTKEGLSAGITTLAADIETEQPKPQVPSDVKTPKKPRRPMKPLPQALQGKTLDIAERSDGTLSGFMRELDKEGYVVFDYETTGLNNDGNIPVQIGAVKIKNGQVVERLNLFTNPERPLGKWARETLKGPEGEPLTDEWLSEQMTLRDAHLQLAEFVGDNVLVAHNYPFDGEVLERTMKESGIDFTPAGTLDTFCLAKQLVPRSYGRDDTLPENHKLSTLADFYGVPLGDGAHTADADCEAAAEILNKIIEHGERREVEPHMLDRAKQQERYDKMMYYYGKQKAEYEQHQAQKSE